MTTGNAGEDTKEWWNETAGKCTPHPHAALRLQEVQELILLKQKIL